MYKHTIIHNECNCLRLQLSSYEMCNIIKIPSAWVYRIRSRKWHRDIHITHTFAHKHMHAHVCMYVVYVNMHVYVYIIDSMATLFVEFPLCLITITKAKCKHGKSDFPFAGNLGSLNIYIHLLSFANNIIYTVQKCLQKLI